MQKVLKLYSLYGLYELNKLLTKFQLVPEAPLASA